MYKLTISVSDKGHEEKGIVRLNTNTAIPLDPDNTDYQAYLKWVAEGNTPEEAE